MTTLTAIEVNCTTGEVTERPLTEAEIAQQEIDRVANEVAKAEEEATAVALAALKASAKAKLISGQPLTQEEASTIVL
jgi:hypothetical protein